MTASWLIDTAKLIEVYYARAPFILGRGKEWVKCNIPQRTRYAGWVLLCIELCRVYQYLLKLVELLMYIYYSLLSIFISAWVMINITL